MKRNMGHILKQAWKEKKGGEYLDLPPKEQVKSYGFRSTSIIQKSKFALRSAE